MDKILPYLKILGENWEVFLGAISAILGGIIAIALVIPGDQPEKALRAVADFLAKFSRKPPQA